MVYADSELLIKGTQAQHENLFKLCLKVRLVKIFKNLKHEKLTLEIKS